MAHLISATAADIAEIHTLAVLPQWRRMGHGTILLDAAEQAWRTGGVREAFLEVRSDNAAALALYEGRGWRAAGRRQDYYGPGADAVVLRWEEQ